jgi:hypothetical protein
MIAATARRATLVARHAEPPWPWSFRFIRILRKDVVIEFPTRAIKHCYSSK